MIYLPPREVRVIQGLCDSNLTTLRDVAKSLHITLESLLVYITHIYRTLDMRPGSLRLLVLYGVAHRDSLNIPLPAKERLCQRSVKIDGMQFSRGKERPAFCDHDTVMLCRHVFEAARAGKPARLKDLYWSPRLNPRGRFTREDGTDGLADYFGACAECAAAPQETVQYIEEYWRGGLLHVADFCRSHS